MTTHHSFIVTQRSSSSPYTLSLLQDAAALGFSQIKKIEHAHCYFIHGELNDVDKKKLAATLFTDNIVEQGEWQEHNTTLHPATQWIEAALRPGVTDPVAEQVMRYAKMLDIPYVQQVKTGQRFIIESTTPLSEDELHRLAQRLLINPVIHHYALGSLEIHFSPTTSATTQVETIALRHLHPEQLSSLSRERRAALDLAEMQAIQHYYLTQQRDPTDIEFETIAQTWSEHCSHKTFKAKIQFGQQTIHGLLNTYIRAATEKIAAPWVWSAFVDNAGIIDFDDHYHVSFKVETHNHPSAIEPFGGANTGLGGVIRDILGVSAKPIAATDIFCFGPQDTAFQTLPAGTLHPRRIRSGVVAGVEDYGNKTGIPTVNGAICYDAGYTANPLVYCGCVGLTPKFKHPTKPQAGDRVIILGGRTGRDGLRGATFSSMTMDAKTGEVAGASVQIGDPIIAKGLIEVVTRARDLELYHAVTDCGAGGLSSAVGEMASSIGADVDLAHVRLKYAGLAPWEIWLSEAQERMVLAVPENNIAALKNLCATYDLELTDMGHFTGDQQLVVRHQEKIVLKLDNEFLHHGMPQQHLIAEMPATENQQPSLASEEQDPTKMLLTLLAHPNIASKADVIRVYDHEIQGGTVVKPLTGVQNDGPSDACVLKPFGTSGTRGIVLANGINPQYGKYDHYAMAVSAVDEAIRNSVAVGANPDRIAILDNFCWGDPTRPETLGALVRAAQGCYDAAIHYQTPFISGKDSLNNEYVGTDHNRHAIPGTLLISALGIIEDIATAVTMDLKTPGNIIYLLGTTKPEFAGSHFALCGGACSSWVAPSLPQHAPVLYRSLHQVMQKKLVRACHDLSEGGLAVALAEMCIGGRLGCDVNLGNIDITTALFSESNGRLLVEVAPEHASEFEAHFSTQHDMVHRLGEVQEIPHLRIHHDSKPIISLSVETLATTWQTGEITTCNRAS